MCGDAVRWGVYSVFFFSSRRRHTRLQGDWSSDVCSSDLNGNLVKLSETFTLRRLIYQFGPVPMGVRISSPSTGSTCLHVISSGRHKTCVQKARFHHATIIIIIMLKHSFKIFGIALLLLVSVVARAVPVQFSAALSGPNESPANASLGTGFAVVTYDATTHMLQVQVTFSGLTGSTTAS